MDTHSYPGTPFSIETHKVDNGKGHWNSVRVVVIRDGQPVGEYLRSYPAFAKATFCPFKIGEDWYALYSKDYTATRVARLSETFEDWCGEKPSGMGFCPTEFFVPYQMTYKTTLQLKGEDKEIQIDNWFDSDYEDAAEFHKDVEEHKAELRWADFGFLSGCYWGDDSSWKLRYIDLSRIPEKILKIEEKFGYWELPGLAIQKCVRIFSNRRLNLIGSFHMDLTKPRPNDSFAEDFFSTGEE